MAKSKDFEAFATSVFGEEFGKANGKKGSSGERHPYPVDALVVDQHDHVLSDHKHKGRGKMKNSAFMSVQDSYDDLPPVSMGDSPITKGEKRNKQAPWKGKERAHNLAQVERPDSGIFLYESDDERTASSLDEHYTKHKAVTPFNGQRHRKSSDRGHSSNSLQLDMSGDDSDEDIQLEYFCVDHMKLCTTNWDKQMHRKCKSNRHVDSSRNDRPYSSALARAGSRQESRAAHAEYPMASMKAMYAEALENMYDYSGLMIDDRENLKAELCKKKLILEENYLDDMEDLIANILQLKRQFLHKMEEFHETNVRTVTKQTSRLLKLRHEARSNYHSFQVDEDYDDFSEYQELIFAAAKKTVLMKEVLKTCYHSTATYDYEFRVASDVVDLLKQEDLGLVETVKATPTLPPFLKSSTEDEEDGEEAQSTLQFLEFCEVVQDSECPLKKTISFTGCTFVLSDTILLADWSNGLITLVNSHGILADKLALAESPWDVERVALGQAVVTVPKLHQALFVETDPHLKVVGGFPTHCECFGVCLVDDKFAVTCDPWSRSASVRLFTKTGELIWSLETDSVGSNLFKCPLHICCNFFNSVIYVSDCTNNCVKALSLNGDIMFCYEHHGIEYTTGLVADRNNYLYVAAKSTGIIQKLTEEGKLAETFLKSTDDLNNPCALCLHPNGDHLVSTDLNSERAVGFWKLGII